MSEPKITIKKKLTPEEKQAKQEKKLPKQKEVIATLEAARQEVTTAFNELKAELARFPADFPRTKTCAEEIIQDLEDDLAEIGDELAELQV